MTTEPQTIRVFVALDLPVQAKKILEQTIQALDNLLPSGVRWVDPKGIHLTLKFLGDVDAERVNGLLVAMEAAANGFEYPSLSLGLSGLGVFPNTRDARILWAGVSGNLAALERLQALVDGALFEIGYAWERRPFRPHLTLGRVRDRVARPERMKIGKVMEDSVLAGCHNWEAREIHLIRSTLTTRGAIYDSIGLKPLAGSLQAKP